MGAIFSTDAIKTELEATIQQAQSTLEGFSENASDLSLLEQTQDYIRQLRGIFQVLEEPAAVLVCDEINACLLALPDDGSFSASPAKGILESISQSLVILIRFLELISLKNKAVPAVLLPAINKLRVSRGAKMVGEGHFFHFQFKPSKPPSRNPVSINRETLQRLKKFRHMYQAAFLHLLRGQRAKGAMQYMGLAMSRIDQSLGNLPQASLYWVASGAIEALVQTEATVTPIRKKLFSLLDRELKFLIQNAPDSSNKPPSLPLMKELLYLIALNKSDSLKARHVAKHFNLPSLPHGEALLEEQRQLLFSPGKGVMASVAEALKDDINGIKDVVDQAARGGQFSAKDLHQRMAKVADVYVMLGLQSPSNVMRSQAKVVGGWADNAAPSDEELLTIADAVLYAESALSRLLQGHGQLDQDSGNKAFKAQVHEARVVLIDESESGLALAKRAITAFMDSNGDKLHLSNVVTTLNGVRGALVFLNSPQAAELVGRATTFIQRELLDREDFIQAGHLEVFADGLSSLEFYLEGLLSNNENTDILKLAVHSFKQLNV